MVISKTKKTVIRCFILSIMILQIGSLQTMEELVRELEELGYINTDAVSNVMLAVDRRDFLNVSELRSERMIYDDVSANIGFGATISAPSKQAEILELMKDYLLGDNKTVLDIGSGSGYVTVCMANMIGNRGLVVGIDHIPELIEFAINNSMKSHNHLIRTGKLKFIKADGRLGYEKYAPYDVIHVGAAVRTIPYNILRQLKKGGRFVGPIGSYEEESVGQYLTVIDKQMDDTVRTFRAAKVYFRYLQDSHSQINFMYNNRQSRGENL